MSVKVPQQKNSYDCGIFVLHFARIFLCDPEFYTAFFLVGGIIPVHLSLSHICLQDPDLYEYYDEYWQTDAIHSLREEFLDYIVCNELSS